MEARTKIGRHYLRATIGAIARAMSMTAEERLASASMAARCRWRNTSPKSRHEQMAVLSARRLTNVHPSRGDYQGHPRSARPRARRGPSRE